MSLKLQLLSDTHNQEYTLNSESDLIVHCGDFSNNTKGVDKFVKKCEDMNKPYVFVLGNHDSYSRYIEDVYKELDDKGYNYLTAGKEFKFQDKTFVGGTLWSNFRANKLQYSDPVQFDKNKEYARGYINDFNYIYYKNSLITPEDYFTLFNEEYNWINQYRGRDDVVVMTHFPPHLCCLDPYWGTHPTASVLNPYFINDLELVGFKTWVAGHTHSPVDTVVDNCRVVINPLGYPFECNELQGKYNPNKLIEIL